jgi:hypothetical protein
MFRTFGAAAVAASLLIASATATFADPSASEGPLAPASQAGVKQALSLGSNTTAVFLGVGLLAGGLALALSGNDNGSATTGSAVQTLP